MNNPYGDIINKPHHVSPTRPPMPMSDRAAQFAPFAALTGYDSAINETGRLTSDRIDMSEEAYERLNRKFRMVAENLNQNPKVRLLYFVPDSRKDGGAYRSFVGVIRRIDEHERVIIMKDWTKIPIDDVIEINSVSGGTEKS